MKDFTKIFIGLCCLVGAFLFGRNYGEKGYRESEEYKAIIKANEELNFAKSELENVKVKFQNIADSAANKKNDELLSQIMNIFLADLSLRIDNKNAFVKPEEKKTEPPPAIVAAPALPPIKKPQEEAWSKTRVSKFKAQEWILINSGGGQASFNALKKVQIQNLQNFLNHTQLSQGSGCAEFLGLYKGIVKDINHSDFGSFEFELKNAPNGLQEQYNGKVAWYNNGSPFSQNIVNSCGSEMSGLNTRIFGLGPNRYAQIYKLANLEKVAGNFYETLPNGTTKIIGSFVLNRVDKF